MTDEPGPDRREPVEGPVDGPVDGPVERPVGGPVGGDGHIRDLLAELGSAADGRRMPSEVAARLDTTLARLVAERETGAPTPEREDESRPGSVVPLRRRWLPRATAAAAAIIVVGAGGVTAVNLGLFGNEASTSSDSGAAGGAGAAESAPKAPVPSSGKAIGAAVLPQVSATSFASDVASMLQRGTASPPAAEAPGSDTGEDSSEPSSGQTGPGQATGDQSAPDEAAPGLTTPEEARQSPGRALRSASCPGPVITDGAVPNQIRYDDQLAVLVIHPETGGRQLVEAWDCAGDRRLAETTITP